MEITEPKRASRFLAMLAVVAAVAKVFDVFFSESVEASEFADALVWFLIGAMCYRFVMFPELLRVWRSGRHTAGASRAGGAEAE